MLAFMQNFQFHLGYNKLYMVEPCGASGGLALFYKIEFDDSILFAANQIIDVVATINGNIVLYI